MSDIATECLAGIGAGFAVSVFLFPAESLKKVLQAGLPVKLWKPYRGFSVFALNVVPTTTVQLSVFYTLSRVIHDENSAASRLAKCGVAAALGAMFATVVENTVTLQTVRECSLRDALTEMRAQHALRPWRSASLIATRDVIFFTFMMVFEPLVRQYMATTTLAGELAAALPLALLGAGLSHPVDTMATHMQKQPMRITSRDALREALRAKGWRGLYAGYAPRCLLFYGFLVIIPRVRSLLKHSMTSFTTKSKAVCGS